MKRISGQALVEHVVLWPVLILLTMAVIQSGLLYRGHATLEHATFMAAREGSINNAWRAPMKKMLASAMAPLDIKSNPNIATYGLAAGAGNVFGKTYAENFLLPMAAGGADIKIISPSKAMFNRFAREQYVLESCSGRYCPGGGSFKEARTRVKQIPNDNLSIRSSSTATVGSGSNAGTINIQDANLLKIRAHWCFPLQVPVVNIAIYKTLNLLGGTSAEARSCQAKTLAHNAAFGYPIYYIPLSAGSVVRMQSAVRCEDSSCSNLGVGGVAASAGNNGTGANSGSNTNGGNTSGSGNTSGNGNTSGGNNSGSGNQNQSGNGGNQPPSTGAHEEPPLCTAQSNIATNAATQNDGVLGEVWNALSAIAGEARDFIRGFWDGIKDQIGDLVGMITDPVETATGLYELAKAFINDPVNTAKQVGEVFGKDLSQLVHCGSYDRGRVLGNYISPVDMLKLVSKLAKYEHSASGFSKALGEAKKEFGCASFAAGTLVAIPSGAVAIEQLQRGTQVDSRAFHHFEDQPELVEATFHRVAPNYHRVIIEHDHFDVTPEHPFWVQGVGWVPIKDISVGTPVAKADGDTMIMSNEVINEPLEVFNIAVESTPNYFVGVERVWVHNASCKWSGIPNNQTAAQFEESIFKLPPGERVARVRSVAASVAAANGMTKDNRLSRLNGRDVYRGQDGKLYAVDTQHGRFEVTDSKGKHLGEKNFEFNDTKPADRSGGHDLKVN